MTTTTTIWVWRGDIAVDVEVYGTVSRDEVMVTRAVCGEFTIPLTDAEEAQARDRLVEQAKEDRISDGERGLGL